MKVFKFGGASVNSASAVVNMAGIVEQYRSEPLVIVVSAMGKTTNNLELLLSEKTGAADDWQSTLSRLKDYHYEIIDNLFGADVEDVRSKIDHFFRLLEEQMQLASFDYNFNYDQIVSIGELVSTTIISEYLNHIGVHSSHLLFDHFQFALIHGP